MLALSYVAPASAHGADAPVAVGYVVRVESVSVPGVVVQAVEGGARLELTNRSGRDVVVLGLQGEEFLRITGRGVEENRKAPTWFASRSISGSGSGGDAAAAPEWHRISTEARVRWHDERARELPARAWSVPLLVDGREAGIVRGTVAKAPVPDTGWWWAGGVLGAVGVALLWRWRRILGGVAVVAGVVVGVWVVQSAALAASPADGVGVQVLARLWPLLTAVGVAGAGVLMLVRRVDIVLGILGACLGVMVGVGDSSVFRYGTLAGPGWGRWAVVVALAAGIGLTVAGGARWYQVTGTAPDQSETEPGTHQDRSETEPGTREDRSETEPGTREDRSETEPGTREDRSETEPGTHEDRSETEPGTREDRSETEPGNTPGPERKRAGDAPKARAERP
ncbi:hypothetical protein [Dactylosporangium sp. CA-139066]|uniref:hypothetical protein n=1 Tax=Dactylosporangium sp. CA-139066 TaxID=3239930 RepID=UPI003D8E0070